MREPTLDNEPIKRIGEVIALLVKSKPMADPTVVHDTFVLERAYAATPERVFAAFADPRAKRHWFAESPDHDIEAFEMNFQIGGAETARYCFKPGGPFEGVTLSNDGTYLDIKPGSRIVTASTMTLRGRRISASLVTVSLTPTADGTTLTCTHQGAFFEGADGPRMREAGWRQRLDQLAKALAH
jgi:uncharacterized protein YndB with AHSA1/START domain